MAQETELSDFTKEELLALAEQFGVEVKHSWNKANVIHAFEEDGVTVELIHGLAQPEPDEDEPVEIAAYEPVEDEEPLAPVAVDDEDLVLVKMTRENWSYEVRGYKFNRTHPFGLVKESDADYLVEVDGGFRTATPREAREYYG